MMSTNFGAAAKDYAQFRAGFPDSLFDRLEPLIEKVDGRKVVDLGTGTGTLARGFAIRGARVVAIDPDNRLLEEARRIDAGGPVAIVYAMGKAEAIPLADNVPIWCVPDSAGIGSTLLLPHVRYRASRDHAGGW